MKVVWFIFKFIIAFLGLCTFCSVAWITGKGIKDVWKKYWESVFYTYDNVFN